MNTKHDTSGGGAKRPSRASSQARVSPYDMIKNAILSGELAPGEPLVETSLAEWCNVSRTPIREALRRLEQDGLVQRGNRGLVVRERGPEEILDIYDTRIVLEALAGRTAAERRTEHDIRLLRRLLERCDEASGADSATLVEVNRQFHRAVWRASHNECLIDLLSQINLHLARYPETTLSATGRWEVACHEHKELVDAIEKRDGDGAHSVGLQHFIEARDIRLALFADEISIT